MLATGATGWLRQGHQVAFKTPPEAARAGDSSDLRLRIEQAERTKWTTILVSFITEAGLPAFMAAQAGTDLVPSLSRVAKGRRASTRKKHVKTWTLARMWLLLTFDRAWPLTAEDFVAYLLARAAEPCARTVPASAQKAFLFVEVAGEVLVESRLSSSPAILNTIEELAITLGTITLQKRQAVQLPVSIVMAWERCVTDASRPTFLRAYAWLRLVKLWAGLRYSDVQGMPPAALKLTDRGLAAALVRTKTSGPGKKIERLFAYVSSSCYLSASAWLPVGFDLWKELGTDAKCEDRDFFLPLPSADMAGCRPILATYADASAMSQALFGDLTSDGDLPLCAAGVGLLWTEHSERATITTWCRSAEISPETVRMLCRWQPACDESYVRSVRLLVETAQARVAALIRSNLGGKDFLDEEHVWDKLVLHLASVWGSDPEQAFRSAVQIASLRSFASTLWSSSGGAVLAGTMAVEVTASTAEVPDEGGDYSPTIAASSDDAEIEVLETQLDDESLFFEEAAVASTALLVSPVVIPLAPPVPTVSLRGLAPSWHLHLFFISITGTARKRRLHKGGECWRIPGIHYNEYDPCGEVQPKADTYHTFCRKCFPLGVGEQVTSSSSDGSSVTSDTDSTS